jgi:hypothetical protein
MIRKADILSADLKRIPGLYRRWELPEILKNQRAYRIENAGCHQDGTSLVAVYADAVTDTPDALTNAAVTEADTDRSGTISRRRE